MSVHWLGIFLVNLSISFQCHHQSSTFTLPNLHGHVSRNGALSEVYKMANMMTLMMSLLHPIQPQAYEIGEHSPGNWSERLPTNGGNVSRVDSIQHPRRFFIYIICIPHSFLKRWVLLSSYAQKHIKKKPDEISFENWLIWFISASSRLRKTKHQENHLDVASQNNLSWNQLTGPTALHDSQGIHPMLSRYSSHGLPF